MATELLEFTDNFVSDIALRQAKATYDLIHNAEKNKERYAALVKEYDNYQLDLLHWLENQDLSGAQMLKFCVVLRRLRRERRKIKRCYTFICGLTANEWKRGHTLNMLRDPEAVGGQSYKIRTDILKKEFGYDKPFLNVKKDKKPE